MSATMLNAGLLFNHAKNACERIAETPGLRIGGQTDALTAIVFAAASLEAFIYEFTDLVNQLDVEPGAHFTAFASLMEELEKSRASIESKFSLGRWVFAAAPYDKGALPYQDFALLIDLRNALIHLRALDKYELQPERGINRAVNPPGFMSRLESKNILAEPQAVSWIARITTRAAARWACNTAAAMVHSLLEVLPQDPYSGILRRVYRAAFPPFE